MYQQRAYFQAAYTIHFHQYDARSESFLYIYLEGRHSFPLLSTLKFTVSNTGRAFRLVDNLRTPRHLRCDVYIVHVIDPERHAGGDVKNRALLYKKHGHLTPIRNLSVELPLDTGALMILLNSCISRQCLIDLPISM